MILLIGYKLTRQHLDVKGSDRQDVGKALTLLSLTTAALFRKYFPNDPNKIELAKFIEAFARAHQVLNSNVIEDKKDPYNCAYRFHLKAWAFSITYIYV